MNTKLTLRLDETLINSAKSYAAKSGKPVSKMVADYFALIDQQVQDSSEKITPVVNSLKGVLKNSNVSEADYKQYLEEKYGPHIADNENRK